MIKNNKIRNAISFTSSKMISILQSQLKLAFMNHVLACNFQRIDNRHCKHETNYHDGRVTILTSDSNNHHENAWDDPQTHNDGE